MPSVIFLKDCFVHFQCKHGEQFTCHSGQCINLTKICDSISDCNDNSDEIDCNLLLIDKSTYVKTHPPTSRTETTKITVDLNIISVDDIDELRMSFKAKFNLNLTWKDSRLEYLYLGSLNILNELHKGSIWYPILRFGNSEANADTEIPDNPTIIEILKQGQPEILKKHEIGEGTRFKGSENDLSLQGTYELWFKCSFDLLSYPFDIQKCNIDLEVPLHLQDHLNVTVGRVDYNGSKQLSQFYLSKISMKDSDYGNIMSCQFELKRIPIYHIFVTFIPTLGLQIIGIIILFLDEDHSDTTIMVSLTCLLVMMCFFQSIIQVVPKTAYLKVIDYWLIFALVNPFTNFIILVSWEMIKDLTKSPKNQTRPQMEPAEPTKSKSRCKMVMQTLFPLWTCLFILAYVVLAFLIYMY